MGLFFKRITIAVVLFTAVLHTSLADPPARPIRSFSELLSFIENQKIKSVNELLPYLDEELRSNYSFIIKSRSEMGATLLEPRVNLFSRDGGFVLAYAGSSEQREGDAIEMMETGPFLTRLSKITFLADGTLKVIRPEHAQECYRCHSTSGIKTLAAKLEAHPVWDTYPDWIDRYGSAHKPYVGNRFRTGSSNAPDSELIAKAYAEFLKNAPNNPRYAHLIDLNSKSLLDLGQLNSDLGDGLSKKSFEKTASIIKSTPHFKTYEASLSKLYSHSQFLQNLPAADRAVYDEKTAAIRSEMKIGQEKYQKEKLKRFKAIHFPNQEVEASTLGPKDYASNKPGLMEFDSPLLEQFSPEYRDLLFVMNQMGLSEDILNLPLERKSFSIVQGYRYFGEFHSILSKVPTLCEGELQ